MIIAIFFLGIMFIVGFFAILLRIIIGVTNYAETHRYWNINSVPSKTKQILLLIVLNLLIFLLLWIFYIGIALSFGLPLPKIVFRLFLLG